MRTPDARPQQWLPGPRPEAGIVVTHQQRRELQLRQVLGEERRRRLCRAGGRDGQGVSLICHTATYANICLTAPKPWRRRGGYGRWHLLGLLSAPPRDGDGEGEEGALKLELADTVEGLWTPTLSPLLHPTFSRNNILACPPDPSYPGLGLALARDLQGP